MYHKKLVTFLSFLMLSSILFSQKKKDKVEYLSNFDKKAVRWGFYLGINRSDYKISYTNVVPQAVDRIVTEPQIGFNVGLIGDMRLHNNINIRIEPYAIIDNAIKRNI